MPQQFQIEWNDSGREPQCPPNPDYPNGIDLDASQGEETTCTVELPYPAQRCGFYLITCTLCGFTMIATTAGRIDDPKSVKLPCKMKSLREWKPEANA
jgi:hypothetical protein